MIVIVEPTGCTVGLAEAHNFQDFKVQVPGGTTMSTIDIVLRTADVGVAEDRYVWVRCAAIERLAAAAGVDIGWRDGYQAMIDYARTRGWWRRDGAIRAHVDWV